MAKINGITAGQIWISTTEPSLGIGRVKKYKEGYIDMQFPLTGVSRKYFAANAPIERLIFQTGDRIMLHDGNLVSVSGSSCLGGLMYYESRNGTVCETEVSDKNVVETCIKRLMSGEFDGEKEYDIRYDTLLARDYAANSPCKDFIGARINPMPHQLFIADRICRRYAPRAILADEVGLGKTVEACLVIKRLVSSRGYHNILIVSPEHLIIQWFSELCRKFGMTFAFVDDTYHAGRKKGDRNFKPVENNDRLILSCNLLENDAGIQRQVMEKKWDMIVTDEAHRLVEGSALYGIIEKISDPNRGMLLLTATPDYPGLEQYFARLKLIDRFSFYKFDRFFWELEQYHQIADLYDTIKRNEKPDGSSLELLNGLLKNSKGYEHLAVENSVRIDGDTRDEILQFLKLRHGISRYLFRNTRKNTGNFPKRRINFAVLKVCDDRNMDNLTDEFISDSGNVDVRGDYDLSSDPRIKWLVEFMNDKKNGKMLLICRTRQKVLAIRRALAMTKRYFGFEIFHEDMELIERDRKAAAFQNDGKVKLLVSSEIGSEGRNFQFCSTLAFFDVPFRSDLIEQRIGRIDRIGQENDIDICLPFAEGSPQEYMINWLHRGFDAFNSSLQGCEMIFESRLEFLKKIALSADKGKPGQNREALERLEELILITASEKKEAVMMMENGRDRLVEINSFNGEEASGLTDMIGKYDDDPYLEYYLNDFFEYLGIKQDIMEEFSSRARQTYSLISDTADIDIFPEIRNKECLATYDRKLAVEREDIGFFNMDHPFIERIFHFVLGSSRGTVSVMRMSGNAGGIMAEMVFLIETMSPQRLNIGRFLPEMHIRIVMDDNLNDVTGEFDPEHLSGRLKDAAGEFYTNIRSHIEKKIGGIISGAKKAAYEKTASLTADAKERAAGIYDREIKRLMNLKLVNNSIKTEEITFIENEKNEILGYLDNAVLRLDMIKVIYIE